MGKPQFDVSYRAADAQKDTTDRSRITISPEESLAGPPDKSSPGRRIVNKDTTNTTPRTRARSPAFAAFVVSRKAHGESRSGHEDWQTTASQNGCQNGMDRPRLPARVSL